MRRLALLAAVRLLVACAQAVRVGDTLYLAGQIGAEVEIMPTAAR